jgi:hypothetical protein
VEILGGNLTADKMVEKSLIPRLAPCGKLLIEVNILAHGRERIIILVLLERS